MPRSTMGALIGRIAPGVPWRSSGSVRGTAGLGFVIASPPASGDCANCFTGFLRNGDRVPAGQREACNRVFYRTDEIEYWNTRLSGGY